MYEGVEVNTRLYPSLPMNELGREIIRMHVKKKISEKMKIRLKCPSHLTAGCSKTGVWLVTTAFGLEVSRVVAGS